jgi:hypothetical protein
MRTPAVGANRNSEGGKVRAPHHLRLCPSSRNRLRRMSCDSCAREFGAAGEVGSSVRSRVGGLAREVSPDSSQRRLRSSLPDSGAKRPCTNAYRRSARVSIRDRRSAALPASRQMEGVGRRVERSGRSTHGRCAPTSCHQRVPAPIDRRCEGRRRSGLVSVCPRSKPGFGARQRSEDARGFRPAGDQRRQRIHEPCRPDLDGVRAYLCGRFPQPSWHPTHAEARHRARARDRPRWAVSPNSPAARPTAPHTHHPSLSAPIADRPIPRPKGRGPSRKARATRRSRAAKRCEGEVGREGFEPSTLGLRVPCSTN